MQISAFYINTPTLLVTKHTIATLTLLDTEEKNYRRAQFFIIWDNKETKSENHENNFIRKNGVHLTDNILYYIHKQTPVQAHGHGFIDG